MEYVEDGLFLFAIRVWTLYTVRRVDLAAGGGQDKTGLLRANR